MKKLFLFAVSVLLTASVMATDFVADGLYFSTLTDNTVQVVKPTEGKYVGDIVIPATVEYNDVTYNVTAIGDNAFQAASQVTSVTLPLTGITTIGSFAFNDCTGLTAFTIPASVTSIGERAFYYCDNLKDLYLYATDPASYNPGNMAFSKIHYGSHVCTVHVPAQSLEAYQASDVWKDFILDAYFYEVTFEDWDGTEIHSEWVTNGSDATAPDDPSRKGYTFTGWDKDFSSVTSDLTVTAQYEMITSGICGAYYDNLTWTFDPATGTLTIEGEGYMKDFDFSKKDEPWYGFAEQITSVSLPDGLLNIGNTAFFNCSSLTGITIPNSVRTIGKDAFYATGLTSVVIPEGVETIKFGAFRNSKLESIVIPSTITTIEGFAFRNCTLLKEITNYAVTPQELGDDVFENVDQANCKLYVHTKSIDAYKSAARWNKFDIEGMEKIFTVTFVDYDGTELKKESVIEGEAATAPADPTREGYTFTGWDKEFANVTSDLTVTAQYERITSGICGKDGEGNLADNLTWSFDTETGVLTIEGTGAMYDYDYDENNDVYAPWQDFEVKQVVLPDGLTTIGNYAFYLSINLTSVDIPEGVTTIGNYAFFYTGLTSVVIPASVTTIGENAFSYTSLTSVVIPESVTTIGENAFCGCSLLTTIDVDANNPNYCAVDGVLFNKDKTTLITYPLGKPETTYSIPNFVTTIGSYAFSYCSLTSVIIPASVITIGELAFLTCDALVAIYDYAVAPQELIWDGGCSPFYYVDQANCKLYVPAKAVEAYKAAEVWKDFDIEAYFFDVTFFDYDGTELKTEQVSKGASATAPADPSRDGYTFTGWDKAFDVITEDLTVTAQYVQNDPTGILSPTLRKEGEKVLRDGVLYILRDGKVYNTQGAPVQ